MIKKLMMLVGGMVLIAGSAIAADDFRNPPGGKIAQHTDSFSGKVTWQLALADGNACQKFISLFDTQPEVLKFAVDCWMDSDSETATLPVKVSMKQKDSGSDVVLESANPAVCAVAVKVLEGVAAYSPAGTCPEIPAPATK